jgi:methyl-accepting chemotaxis protein
MLTELTVDIRTASLQGEAVKVAVKLQTSSVNDTKSKYLAIVKTVDNINKEITALNQVSKDMEQSRAIVADFGSNVSAISQEYAASTEETSATTEEVLAAMTSINQIGIEIDNLVSELKQLIDRFKLV